MNVGNNIQKVWCGVLAVWAAFWISGCEQPQQPSVTRRWVEAAPMAVARSYSLRLIALPDGKVVAVSNHSHSNKLSAETYDPETNRWEAPVPMPNLMSMDDALLTMDGRIMIYDYGDHAFYDPQTRQWSSEVYAVTLDGYRLGLVSVLSEPVEMADGRILFTGDGFYTPKAAVAFDPVRRSLREMAPMAVPRYDHVAIALDDGRILVAGGGNDGNIWRSAELYDPELNQWTRVADMHLERSYAHAVRLSDGQILVLGGMDAIVGDWRRPQDFEDLPSGFASCALIFSDNTAEIFDPQTGRWSWAEAFEECGENAFRSGVWRVVALPGNRALLMYNNGETLVYDATANIWQTGPKMLQARSDTYKGAVLVLSDGRVMVAGGAGPDGRASTEVEILMP